MPRRMLLALLTLLGAGCASEPLTEIVLVVVGEPALRARQPILHARVVHGPDGPAPVEYLHANGHFRDDAFVIALSPRDGAGTSRYLVEVEAVADGETLATARLLAGYVAGQTRYVKLMLEAACIGVSHCDARSTCHAGGCVSAEADAQSFSRDADRVTRSTDGAQPAPVAPVAPVTNPAPAMPVASAATDASVATDAATAPDAPAANDASQAPPAPATDPVPRPPDGTVVERAPICGFELSQRSALADAALRGGSWVGEGEGLVPTLRFRVQRNGCAEVLAPGWPWMAISDSADVDGAFEGSVSRLSANGLLEVVDLRFRFTDGALAYELWAFSSEDRDARRPARYTTGTLRHRP
ncbi:MAG: hypothetical protein ABW252_04290 [Polyangiales bacterium]